MNIKRLAAAGLATTGFLAVSVGLGNPASAGQYDCPSGYACLWEDRDFSGTPWYKGKTLGFYNTGWVHNDDVSSVWNRYRGALYLYNNDRGTSSDGVVCVPGGYGDRNLSDNGFEDRASSFRLTEESCPSGVGTVGNFLGF
jgi:hypothetical protein